MMKTNDGFLPSRLLTPAGLFPTARRLTSPEAWVVLLARLAAQPRGGCLRVDAAELAALWHCSERAARQMARRFGALGLVRVARQGAVMELRPAWEGENGGSFVKVQGTSRKTRGLIENKKESSKEKNKDKTIRDRDENGPQRARVCEAVRGFCEEREQGFLSEAKGDGWLLRYVEERHGVAAVAAGAYLDEFHTMTVAALRNHSDYGDFRQHFRFWVNGAVRRNDMKERDIGSLLPEVVAAPGRNGSQRLRPPQEGSLKREITARVAKWHGSVEEFFRRYHPSVQAAASRCPDRAFAGCSSTLAELRGEPVLFLILRHEAEGAEQAEGGEGGSDDGRIFIAQSVTEGEGAGLGADGVAEVEGDLYTCSAKEFATGGVADDKGLLRRGYGEEPEGGKRHEEDGRGGGGNRAKGLPGGCPPA